MTTSGITPILVVNAAALHACASSAVFPKVVRLGGKKIRVHLAYQLEYIDIRNWCVAKLYARHRFIEQRDRSCASLSVSTRCIIAQSQKLTRQNSALVALPSFVQKR